MVARWLLLLATLICGGCLAPNRQELVRAQADPLATPESIVGDYGPGQQGQSLSDTLHGIAGVAISAPTTRPAAVRLSVRDGHLAARVIGDGSPTADVDVPGRFVDGYFRGTRSESHPATPCVPATYETHAFVISRRRSDGALVVVSKSDAWALFPIPYSGPSGPVTAIFPSVSPATRPAGAP